MEVLIGEEPGGDFFADLLIEKEGVSYEKDSQGNPILPPFRVANVPPPTAQKGQKQLPVEKDRTVWRAEKPK